HFFAVAKDGKTLVVTPKAAIPEFTILRARREPSFPANLFPNRSASKSRLAGCFLPHAFNPANNLTVNEKD
ncbi:MAG: hypothetical protein ABIV39_02010, partial [Verrucomicrobiota bacterium]